MTVTRREFLAAAALAPAALGQSRPPGPGQHALKLGDDRDGLVYAPKGYRPGAPLPLLMMLHGAGNTSLSVQYTFPLADELNIIILAPDSRDERTWDGVLRSWGPDLEFMASALEQTAGRFSIDRGHLGVGGFSDGGSYALS